jgi:hypothetical protein
VVRIPRMGQTVTQFIIVIVSKYPASAFMLIIDNDTHFQGLQLVSQVLRVHACTGVCRSNGNLDRLLEAKNLAEGMGVMLPQAAYGAILAACALGGNSKRGACDVAWNVIHYLKVCTQLTKADLRLWLGFPAGPLSGYGCWKGHA